MCVAVAETSSLGGQVVKVLKLPGLPRRVGVNVNYGRLFLRVFSGTGFLGFPLLLVITQTNHCIFQSLILFAVALKQYGSKI